MSLFINLNGADIGATAVRLRSGSENGIPGLTTSANGQGSMGGIVFDNPTGSMTVRGWMAITVDEADCTAAPRIGTGYVGDRTYQRGPYLTGAGSQIDTTIYDPMALLSFLLITGKDGKRPAETHIQRIDWLLASTYNPPGSGTRLVTDLGLVDRSNPRPFPATDYRGKFAADVLNDLAGPIFRTFFVYWDQSAHALGLFFDSPTATTNTATLTISNVPADVNNTTCFYPSKDARLGVDPSSVYAKLRMTYRNGTVITNEASTASTFFSGLGYRGVQVDNDRVGLESTAREMSDGILDQDHAEAETLQFTVQLPSTKVGLIDAGMRLGVRFQHLPGYTSLTYVRVEGRTIMQSEGNDKQYDVQLTCSNHGLTNAIGGGNPGGFPAPGTCSPTPSQAVPVEDLASSGTHVTITKPDVGDLLIGYIFGRGTITGTNGCTDNGTGAWTEHPSSPLTPAGGSDVILRAYEKIAAGNETSIFLQSGGSGNKCQATVFVIPQASIQDRISHSGPGFGPPQPFVTGSLAATRKLMVTGVVFNADDISHDYAGVVAGATEVDDGTVDNNFSPGFWIGYAASVASLTGSWNHNNGYGGLSYGIDCDTSADPPLSGQWVYGEVVTMSTVGGVSTGTLANVYAGGSVRVRVDGVLISKASYTETGAALTPQTGAIALTWIIDTDEVVTVDYQGV